MNKFFLLFLALGAVAFAGEADGESMIKAYSVVEAQVIYTLVIALIALYANPFLG
ncbi:ATP synthase F0 sector subunit c [hydrothermal vent metagenome]|uniref:ATP synthase F0 sector subunit c n=1 Tax=hydrothermal vent metagenome TaxID=652676 RepID=A0A1W1CXJ7_9ZZZZ